MRIDHRTTTAALALVTGLCGPGAAYAASFDCARATSAIEKRICADPQLSRDDEALAAAYARALAAAPLPFAVRDDQRGWIANVRDKAASNADLHTGLVSRAAELASQTAIDIAAARPVALAALTTHCTAPRADSGTCKVEASGRIAGGRLAWQRRIYNDGDLRSAAGITVYAVEGTSARPIVWHDEEGAWFEDPALIASPVGTLLDLGGHLDGTGNYSAEMVLLEEGAAWRPLDIGAIDFAGHVPRDRAVWKGVYPDWRRMTVDTPLWKQNDGNCCPTGGTVHATLKRVGYRILVDRARYDPKPLSE